MDTLKLLPSQRVYNGELSYWKTQAMVLAQRNDDLRYIFYLFNIFHALILLYFFIKIDSYFSVLSKPPSTNVLM